MRGVVFTGDREIELRTFEDPSPGLGMMVLEMKASGGPSHTKSRRPLRVVAAIDPGVRPQVTKGGDRRLRHKRIVQTAFGEPSRRDAQFKRHS